MKGIAELAQSTDGHESRLSCLLRFDIANRHWYHYRSFAMWQDAKDAYRLEIGDLRISPLRNDNTPA